MYELHTYWRVLLLELIYFDWLYTLGHNYPPILMKFLAVCGDYHSLSVKSKVFNVFEKYYSCWPFLLTPSPFFVSFIKGPHRLEPFELTKEISGIII